MKDLDSIGGRLKAARQAKGLRQVDVAKVLGNNPVSVSEWEVNKYIPNALNLSRLAKLYDVSEDWLLHGGVQYLAEPPAVQRVSGHSTLAAELQRMIVQFERDCVRSGASNADADHVTAVLISPAVSVTYRTDDTGAPLTLDLAMRELTFWFEALKLWVRQRVRSHPSRANLMPNDDLAVGAPPPAAPTRSVTPRGQTARGGRRGSR